MAAETYLKTACAQCGGHIEFPAEGLGATTPCPHCGAPTELTLPLPGSSEGVTSSHRKWLLAGAGILVGGLVVCVALLFAAQHLLGKTRERRATRPVVRTAPPPTPAAGDGHAALVQGFRPSAITVAAAPGSTLVYASGTLHNATDRQRFGVAVELELLNAGGAVVGNARDYAAVIEPRAEWRFRALVVRREATAARLARITEQ